MRDARAEILARLRTRLGRPEGGPVDLPDSLTGAAVRPAVREDTLGCFVERATAAAAGVVRLTGAGDAPAATVRMLESHGLPPEIAVGADPALRSLPWSEAGLRLLPPGEHPTNAAATRAIAAMAETGTVVLASGPDQPMLHNFLPDHHFVLLEAGDVVAHQEEVWQLVRGHGLPRALTFVTGPSRTGDIEFTLQLGAHGPRHLHILLVGSGDAGPSEPAASPRGERKAPTVSS